MAEKVAAPKARYYEKSGKILDAGVEISDKEAERILAKNAERRVKNAEQVKKGAADDSDLGAIMGKVNQYANDVFDREDKELSTALATYKATKK